jgi:ribosome biogenesis GTPase
MTKADLVDSVDEPHVPATVIVTSSVTGDGIADVAGELQPDRTGMFVGPSGAGKSSLLNALLGAEVMRTRDVHRSGEGRHMTSHRQLFRLPGGGAIIDTPGLREAQVWRGEEALGEVFEDVESIALQCRFADCTHDTEPGCAITSALASGVLDAGRWQSYRKLQRELRSVAVRSDARLRAEDRKKWKQIATAAKRARP